MDANNKKTLTYRIVTKGIELLMHAMLKIDKSDYHKVPKKGPLIMLGNHINILEAPTLYSTLQPRPITGLVKSEFLENKFINFIIFKQWGGIPLRRGEADLKAFQQAKQALNENMILVIAPEGTRSGHGRLQEGKAGTALLALRANVPILPVGFSGTENYKENLKRLKRTPFNVRIGNIFTLDTGEERISRDLSEKVITEMMYQIAALLPPAYRGFYSDLENATEHYIRFAPGVKSNLTLAE